MKYWAYLVAKLAVAGVFLYRLGRSLPYLFPPAKPRFDGIEPFGHDLGYTFLMLLYSLVSVGVVWAVIHDQRYRCRTCLRRLRMPILTGNWTHILLGRYDLETTKNATESLCAGIRHAQRTDWTDSAHLPSLEHPDRFTDLLRGWLADRNKPKSKR